MRAHNNEHFDSLPSLDVNALKHIAYVFDGLVYYIRSGMDGSDSEAIREGFNLESWNDQVFFFKNTNLMYVIVALFIVLRFFSKFKFQILKLY